jgi:hypothetical protein
LQPILFHGKSLFSAYSVVQQLIATLMTLLHRLENTSQFPGEKLLPNPKTRLKDPFHEMIYGPTFRLSASASWKFAVNT